MSRAPRTLVLGLGRLDPGQAVALSGFARRHRDIVLEVRVPLDRASPEEVLADCLDLRLRVKTSRIVLPSPRS
jgi:hypothetical protein